MKGTSWMRRQDVEDALLNRLLIKEKLDDIPFFSRRLEAREKHMRRWSELTPERDGPVAAKQVLVGDPTAMAVTIKAHAKALGADQVGIARLTPDMVEMDVEMEHDWVIPIIVHEHYDKVLGGPDAVDVEAFRVYARCAEIATDLARHIREELGHAAWAHHNGSVQVQAIPALHAAGFGELGKHGSLINPDFGAGFRPGFVTTTLPLVPDEPLSFGVQDYCMNCKLCMNACPGDAIPPAEDHILTDGVKRWLTDIEKCYGFSRLRPEYCHLCIDVCPYVHKENGNADAKGIYKQFLGKLKKQGWGAAKEGAAASEGNFSSEERFRDYRMD